MPHNNLISRDQQCIWHPFTQHGLESECLPIKSAEGAWLILEDGTKLLDGISSWWVNLHGHAHPAIAQAIFEEAKQLGHVMLAGFTHRPAVKLAETLLDAANHGSTHFSRCFYSDNGATVVEATLKMAYQYHQNKGGHKRTRFIALEGGYHGDTLGCMMVSSKGSFGSPFDGLLPKVDFISPEDVDGLKTLLKQHAQEYAAIIVEPLVQGASAGIRIYSPEFLSALATLCQNEGILLICDEVFTGFYRTGTCFAFQQANIQPDFICLGKGMSGGMLTIGVTLTTENIFQAFYSTDIKKAFLHGHTYSGNPLACAASLASWDLLQQAATQTAIDRISLQTRTWINQLSQHPNVSHARCLGTIGAVDIKNFPNYFSNVGYKIRRYAIEQGVLLRPLGKTIYTVPPYCITSDELDRIYQVITSILDQVKLFQ